MFNPRIDAPAFDARAQLLRSTQAHLGWKWGRFRTHWLRAHPLCEDCGALGEHVHHIIPRSQAPNRTFDATNLATLCVECHDKKHRGG